MKITPETLTAYLDGELDEAQASEIRERSLTDAEVNSALAVLQIDRDGLALDYQALEISAPMGDLRSKLAVETERPSVADNSTGNRRLLMAAACAACLVIGVLTGTGIGDRGGADKSWREAVAEYQVLYSTETLAWNAVAPAEVDTTLEHLSERIGVKLTRPALSLETADFKRGQMLTFGSRPLVQLAYLHDGVTPVAFCITTDGAPDAGLATEIREGLPIVHWANAGTSYMIIGKIPEEQLTAMAQTLRGRF